MKKLYVLIEIPDEQWKEWSKDSTDPIDALGEIAAVIDCSSTRLDLDSTVWGSLEDFLHDNVLDALGDTPKE